jgi:hypothetical protein
MNAVAVIIWRQLLTITSCVSLVCSVVTKPEVQGHGCTTQCAIVAQLSEWAMLYLPQRSAFLY